MHLEQIQRFFLHLTFYLVLEKPNDRTGGDR